jgi:hypothetical protein
VRGFPLPGGEEPRSTSEFEFNRVSLLAALENGDILEMYIRSRQGDASLCCANTDHIICTGSLSRAAEGPARQWRKPADAFAEGIFKVFARATCYER